MKVCFGVLIVLVVLTLAEGGKKGKLDPGARKAARKAARAARKCNKMNKKFEGCLEKGYNSICDESVDNNEEEEVVVNHCPTDFPNVYYNGQHCCASNMEKVYAPQGAQCDGSVIQRDSLCCAGDQHTPCPGGNCASYQPSRSKRESEPEEAPLSKKELKKCARVERNLMKKCDYEC